MLYELTFLLRLLFQVLLGCLDHFLLLLLALLAILITVIVATALNNAQDAGGNDEIPHQYMATFHGLWVHSPCASYVSSCLCFCASCPFSSSLSCPFSSYLWRVEERSGLVRAQDKGLAPSGPTFVVGSDLNQPTPDCDKRRRV